MSVGTTGAIIGGVVAGAGTVVGGAMAAGAQKDASQQQIAYQEYALQQEIKMRQETQALAMSTSVMSPGELASIGQMLQTQSTGLSASLFQIQQQMSALNAADPALKSAGEQTLQLLNGQTSRYLDPVMAQRDQQRSQMQNQMAAQLGPGWRTSTAGIQAMTQFDMATNSMTAQVQQQALQEVSGTFSSLFGQQQQGLQAGTAAVGNAFGTAFNQGAAIDQAYSYATTRQTNAVLGATTASPINFQGPANVAGNPNAGITMGNTFGQAASGVGGAFGVAGGMAYQQNQQQQNQQFWSGMMGGGQPGGGSAGTNIGTTFGAPTGFGSNNNWAESNPTD